MRKINLLGPQNLANVAWAFATLGLRSEPMLAAISTATTARIAEFTQGQNLSNVAWAFASSQVYDASLMAAIAYATQVHIEDFDQQGLSNSAWAFARVGCFDEPLFNVLTSAAQGKLQEFSGQNLANFGWAVAILHSGSSLLHSLAMAASKAVKDLTVQSLADLSWACSRIPKIADPTGVAFEVDAAVQQLRSRLLEAATQISFALPSTVREEDWLQYQGLIWELHVVNLRFAAHQVLRAMNVADAPLDFAERAVARIRGEFPGGERPLGLGGAGVDTTAVRAYAEFSVVLLNEASGAEGRLEGQLWRSCGVNSNSQPLTPPLWPSAFRLPGSSHVDRELCAEFQILVELTLQLQGHLVVGCLSLFTTTSPCMSCLGAMRQFQLLFPEVSIEFAVCAEDF